MEVKNIYIAFRNPPQQYIKQATVVTYLACVYF